MSTTIETAEAIIWSVLDMNQAKQADRNQPRVHTAPSGREYALYSAPDKKTPMPKSDALVFLRDPSFKV